MAPAEIAAEYRQAKKPMLQIGILADLNGCTKKEIAAVLREQGCELPERYKTAQEKAKANTSSGAVAPPSPQGEGNESQGCGSDAGESLESRSIMQLAEAAYQQMLNCQKWACLLHVFLTGAEFPPVRIEQSAPLRDLMEDNLQTAAYVAELLELAVDTLGGGADD